MPVVSVKKPLREKLGDDGVDALIELINEAQAETQKNVIKIVEEKFEKRLAEELGKIRVEIAELKSELKSDIESLRAEMKSDNERLRSETKSDKADLIKWMFIFWAGQIGAILGILFAFFKS